MELHMEAPILFWPYSWDEDEVIEVKVSFWYSVLFFIPIVMVYVI